MLIVSLFGSVFVASLLGSLHCAGMCGPLLAFLGGTAKGPQAGSSHTQWLYHGGRLLTYLMLGAAAGALGTVVNSIGALAGIGTLALIVASGIIAYSGGRMLMQQMGLTSSAPPRAHGWSSRLFSWLARSKMPPALKPLSFGLVTTLLPCGWLYTFATTAGATGSWWQGIVVMAAFWLGTLPALVTLAELTRRASGAAQRWLPRAVAVLMLVVGSVGLVHRAQFFFATKGPEAVSESCH